jgi:hypothetical protein
VGIEMKDRANACASKLEMKQQKIQRTTDSRRFRIGKHVPGDK